MRRYLAPAALLALSACQTPSADPLAAARAHRSAGELVAALEILDAVPTTYSNYPACRELAAAIERRVRSCQAQVHEGMRLRESLEDEAALRCFERAQSIWPESPWLAQLVRGTRDRTRMSELRRRLQGPTPKDLGRGSAPVSPAPVPELEIPRGLLVEWRPPVPPKNLPRRPPTERQRSGIAKKHVATPEVVQPLVGEKPVADTTPAKPKAKEIAAPGPVASVAASKKPAKDSTKGAVAAAGTSAVPAPSGRLPQLEVVQRRLEDGDTVRAIGMLEALLAKHPTDRRVLGQFAHVLHQRALVAFGEGRMQDAIADWRRLSQAPFSDPLAAKRLRDARTQAQLGTPAKLP